MKVSLKDSLAPLRLPGYRAVFLANTASYLGDQIVTVALAFAILEVNGSASALGLVLLARTVPLAFFVLTGRVWTDRLPRQSVMVVSNIVHFVSQGLFAALLFTDHAAVWAMVLLQAIHGMASAFLRPAASGLLAQLLPGELWQRGTALMYSMSSMAGILGPALAGVILAVSSPTWALALDALTFAISGLLLARIRTPDREPARKGNSFVRDLAEGWGDVVSRPWLRSWIFNFAMFQFTLLAAFMAFGPLVTKTSLGGEAVWAVMSACVGAGSLVGSAVALRWHPTRPLTAVGGALLLAPVVILGLAATPACTCSPRCRCSSAWSSPPPTRCGSPWCRTTCPSGFCRGGLLRLVGLDGAAADRAGDRRTAGGRLGHRGRPGLCRSELPGGDRRLDGDAGDVDPARAAGRARADGRAGAGRVT